jgi:MoxR-like ATPase
VLSYDALADGVPADHVVKRIVQTVPLPQVAPRQRADGYGPSGPGGPHVPVFSVPQGGQFGPPGPPNGPALQHGPAPQQGPAPQLGPAPQHGAAPAPGGNGFAPGPQQA